jgi:hypothetical protein
MLGIAKKPTTTTGTEIDSLIMAIKTMLSFGQTVRILLEGNLKALQEFDRLRAAIKKNRQALDWDAFLAKFEGIHAELADTLKSARVERFDLGKLELLFKSDDAAMHVDFVKGLIANALADEYGSKFSVAVKSSIE